ncbi:hypothetical protein CANCADRAFT_137122 [Tortispora caseinolytica NRRL Y-17796]|uniref:Uncharacterized protein n=1 Tax=Tortispora caseinolytica NRRL Y-17796 TaxID=767744 RepID=A0A1E4TC47_9ASCO|nr:hypothetical protein CANCADRAFT_137122 [Tortispora caseinolytica NRRL Y-17796]
MSICRSSYHNFTSKCVYARYSTYFNFPSGTQKLDKQKVKKIAAPTIPLWSPTRVLSRLSAA